MLAHLSDFVAKVIIVSSYTSVLLDLFSNSVIGLLDKVQLFGLALLLRKLVNITKTKDARHTISFIDIFATILFLISFRTNSQ